MVEAIVEFNYKADQPDELTLTKGDIIQGIVQQEGGWWTGMLNGRKGVFPDNFVRVLEKKDRRRCVVLFSYAPVNSDELELQVDQELEIIDEIEEGWWKGKLGDKVGVFPSNFVKVLPEAKKNDIPLKAEAKQEKRLSPKPVQKAMSKSAEDARLSSKSKMPEPTEVSSLPSERELCRVTFGYNAVNNDELTLQVGEIVTILNKDTQEKGWWKGEVNGKVGVFPDNFVEIIKTDSAPSLRKKNSESKKKIPDPVVEDKSSAASKTPPLLPKKPKAPPPQEVELKKMRPAPEPKMNIPDMKPSIPPSAALDAKSKILAPPLDPKSTPPAASETKSGQHNEFDSVQRNDMLVQPERPKAPRRRPPSTVLKQNGHADGNEEEAVDNGVVEDIKVSIEMKPREQKSEEPALREPQKMEMKKSPFMEELKGAFNQTKKDKPPPAKPRPVSFGLSITAPMTSPRKSPTTDELKAQVKPMPEKRPPSVDPTAKPEMPKPEPPKVEMPKPDIVKLPPPKPEDPKKVSFKCHIEMHQPLTLEERVKELEETVKKLASALRDETRYRLRLEEEVERLSNRVVQI
ncbi:SH3 domain-containing kinase-binding protein 1 isoform X3 [Cloeon dipterum]|uniref:SH3 domain-containing kinase-binding protein 1 isoform X3 n=1 Tax=Cloeon dipterum TaxID=197152 RepID=UPI00321FF1AC